MIHTEYRALLHLYFILENPVPDAVVTGKMDSSYMFTLCAKQNKRESKQKEDSDE